MKPLVSIIVPNYNHSNYLIERLDSIFNQTFQNFEVIILDDSSTDNSLSILNQYKNHKKVSHFIVNEKNSGSPFKQWKKGMQLAIGKYIWIAETDDFAKYNFLETQLPFLENSDLVVSKTEIVDNFSKTNNLVSHPVFSNANSQKLTASFFLTSPIKNVSCVLFKNPNILNISNIEFINYSIMGDQVFYYEFFKDKIVCYNDNTTSYFRRVITSVSNSNSGKGMPYFLKYYKEYLNFSKLLENQISEFELKKYKKRHFNKVRNNTSKKSKLHFKFLNYYFKNLIN